MSPEKRLFKGSVESADSNCHNKRIGFTETKIVFSIESFGERTFCCYDLIYCINLFEILHPLIRKSLPLSLPQIEKGLVND